MSTRRDKLELEIKYFSSGTEDLTVAKDVFLSLTSEILRQRTYCTTIRYFDTENFDLYKSGVTLRKMDACKPHFSPEIAVKTLGVVLENGVLSREEFPFVLPSEDFDLKVVTDPRAQDLIKPADGKPLTEYFQTVNARSDIRAVFNAKAKRAAFEICVERTDYIDSASGKPLKSSYEIEIEFSTDHSDPSLTEEDAADVLGHIGQALQRKMTALEPNALSKAEIGFSFYLNKQKPTLHKAPHP